MLRNGKMPPCEKVVVEGTNPIPVFLLDAPAYSLLLLLVKATFHNKKFFSEGLSNARITGMNSLGKLKARLRWLQRMVIDMDIEINTLPKVTYSFLQYTTIVIKKGKNFRTEPCVRPEPKETNTGCDKRIEMNRKPQIFVIL